jgi:hypothetical protein
MREHQPTVSEWLNYGAHHEILLIVRRAWRARHVESEFDPEERTAPV